MDLRQKTSQVQMDRCGRISRKKQRNNKYDEPKDKQEWVEEHPPLTRTKKMRGGDTKTVMRIDEKNFRTLFKVYRG